MSLRVNTDIAAGVFGLAFAAGFWFSMGRMTNLSALFPETVLLLTAVISLALLAKGLLRPDVREVFGEGNRLRMAVTTVILFAWWWLIGVLGFFVASVLAFVVLTWYLAIAQRPVRLHHLGFWVCIVVAEVSLFYIVFTKLLYIRPPRGLLF